MNKFETAKRIIDCGVVAIIRAESPQQALKVAEAAKAGGIDVIEITMTVPDALSVIKELRKVYANDEIVIGAGTVLDAGTARAAMLAGAEFIVSPNFDREIVRLCNLYRKVTMQGAMSVTEIVDVLESGADFVKLFPGSAFGPSFVKAVLAPLPQAPLVPTGGVSLENVGEWIKAGCLAVGVGGELTKGASSGDFSRIEETARKFIEAVRQAKKQS